MARKKQTEFVVKYEDGSRKKMSPSEYKLMRKKAKAHSRARKAKGLKTGRTSLKDIKRKAGNKKRMYVAQTKDAARKAGRKLTRAGIKKINKLKRAKAKLRKALRKKKDKVRKKTYLRRPGKVKVDLKKAARKANKTERVKKKITGGRYKHSTKGMGKGESELMIPKGEIAAYKKASRQINRSARTKKERKVARKMTGGRYKQNKKTGETKVPRKEIKTYRKVAKRANRKKKKR